MLFFVLGKHRFYDQLSRLLEADYDNGMTVYQYGYDLAGNLVNNNGTTRTYNAANQMVNDGTNTLTYDANGNLTNDGVNSYTWDRANRMLTAPGSTSYKYDGLGNRIQQTVSAVVTDYLNDVQPGLVKLLRQDDGSNVDHFVHAPRGIHAVDDGTDWTWFAQDGLGSVRGLVDDTAVVQQTHEYDPYGNYIGTAPTDAYFGFTGEYTDKNEQLYLRARYYKPEMGVFSALDPFEGMMHRPMSLNRHSWVEGNVPNLTDPSGLCVFILADTAICGGIAIGAAALGLGIGVDQFVSKPLSCAADPDTLSCQVSPTLGFLQMSGQAIQSGIAGIGSALSTGASNVQTFFNQVGGALSHRGSTPPPNNDDFYNAAAQELFDEAFDNITETLAEIDPRDMAAIANSAWVGLCGAAKSAIGGVEGQFQGTISRSNIGSLLDVLALIGVIAISTVRPNEEPDNDDDCLGGKTAQEAAREYALKARAIYDELASNLGGNPPAVISLTRAKRSLDSDCKYFVGINNVLSSNENDATRRRHLNRARNGAARAADVILNQFPITVFGSSGPIGTGDGEAGHAEYNLYINLTAQGASVVAIGLSKRPCIYCNSYFSELPVVLDYEE